MSALPERLVARTPSAVAPAVVLAGQLGASAPRRQRARVPAGSATSGCTIATGNEGGHVPPILKRTMPLDRTDPPSTGELSTTLREIASRCQVDSSCSDRYRRRLGGKRLPHRRPHLGRHHLVAPARSGRTAFEDGVAPLLCRRGRPGLLREPERAARICLRRRTQLESSGGSPSPVVTIPSEGPNALRPLRLIAVFLALWVSRADRPQIRFSRSWHAPALGLGAFLLVTALERATATAPSAMSLWGGVGTDEGRTIL